jgi:TRAP-type transport system periplasmic protein
MPISSNSQFYPERRYLMKVIRIVSLVALVSVLSSWAILTEGHAQGKTITLRYSTMWPPTHPQGILAKLWCTDIEKATNERVKILIYLGGTLVSPQQTYDSVVKGVVDIGYIVPGYTMGKFPLTDVTAYPLGMSTGVMASKIGFEYFFKFKPAEFEDVKVFYLAANGPGIIHTRKPVQKLEDLKGVKIRALGPLATFISALGALPVAMPMGETYDAISRGVVDGLYAPYQVLVDYKLGEVVKYSIENFGSSYSSIGMVVMNKEKWNSVPPDVQAIMDRISQGYVEKMGKLGDDSDKEGVEFAVKKGVKVIKLSPDEDRRWAEKTEPLFAEYIKNMKEKNLPGEEVIKFYRERIKAYN